MGEAIAGLVDLVLGYYCRGNVNNTISMPYLIAIQFSNSTITNDPPNIGNPTKEVTICGSNTTCFGFPEFGVFQTKILGRSGSEVMQFSPELLLKLFAYNSEKPIRAESTLFHRGNMMALWGNGSLFAKGDSGAL